MDIGCLRIPHFSAWAFEHAAGENGAVIVSERGRVAAAASGPRQAGIEAGMSIQKARTLRTDAEVRVRDRQLEKAAWEEVLLALYEVTPRIVSREPGTAFFAARDEAAVRHLARELSARVALAPSRGAALLGAIKAASGNTLRMEEADADRFLHRFETRRLEEAGFPEEMTGRLVLFGYKTAGAVRALSERHLAAQFGEEGRRLYQLLGGKREPIPFFELPSAVRDTYHFEHPAREPGQLLPALEHLAERAARALRGRLCRRVAVVLATGEEKLRSCRLLRRPEAESSVIFRAAGRLVNDLLKPGRRIVTLTLKLGALTRPEGRQGALFEDRPVVQKAVEAVCRRYPGALVQPEAERAGLFEEDRFRLVPCEVGEGGA